ncbi:MAG TPA: HEAT repeat domain-containing protein, partial [Chlamydiales bacterium]|nr:HEAT repeat domain-containing protein [Chlamydiales bacterium]
MKKFWITPLFIFSALYGNVADEHIRRIQSALVLNDFNAVIEEAEEGVKSYPETNEFQFYKAQAYVRKGEFQKAYALIDSYRKDYEKYIPQIEDLCWQYLYKAAESNYYPLQQMSMLASFYVNDAKSVELLSLFMKSSNAILRQSSISLAMRYRDDILQKEILALLKKEKNYSVRIEAIKALGAMRSKQSLPYLKMIIENSNVQEGVKVHSGALVKNAVLMKRVKIGNKAIINSSIISSCSHIDEAEVTCSYVGPLT